MGVHSVSSEAHLVVRLVDRVKYDLGPGCHAWPRRVSPASGEAELAGCFTEFAGGPLE